MTARPAQYLLRFDDLCPTMDRARWQRFVPLLDEFQIKPILAVVPDNQDPALMLSSPDPDFWAQMRAMEAGGAAIGLHGYRHVCKALGRSLVRLHRVSEFAGVPEETQREWIHAGLEILRGQGLHPAVWVAPRHGFDHATLRALCKEGIGLLSDGFARRPFARGGVTWIPQQLWAPVAKTAGLWTICFHANSAPDSLVAELALFLREHAAQFTSVQRVKDEFQATALSFTGRLDEAAASLRTRARRAAKSLLRHS